MEYTGESYILTIYYCIPYSNGIFNLFWIE
jgi:hypothetical protein